MSSLARVRKHSEFSSSDSYFAENKSSSGSDWLSSSPKGTRNQITTITESMLAAISDVIKLVVCIEIEREIFIQIGCYLYRTSAVIKELQTEKNTAKNAVEIIQSLSKIINHAKELTTKGKVFADRKQHVDLEDIAKQLQGLVKKIATSLSLIPMSIDGEKHFAEVAAKSLSEEMESAHFEQFTPYLRELSKRESAELETDLYSIDVEVSAVSLQLLNAPRLPLTDERDPSHHKTGSGVPRLAHYIEPLYEAFFCPLTKKIMDDPVTLESGLTYERDAIIECFNKYENADEIVCPITGKKLTSRILTTNVALKATIDEWKERNEAAKIKIAWAALSLGSTENMILEAIDDLQAICRRKHCSKVQICDVGTIPLLSNLLDYKTRAVRCATLELLQQLAEDGDEEKEIIANTIDISKVIRMLSSNHGPIRRASMLLLFELSMSHCLQHKIKSVSGAIMMLIVIQYKHSSDAFASEKANEILKNLASSLDNIKLMAENGYWQPLLNHLDEGSEEMKTEMADYLGEIVLQPNNKTYVAERASQALIKMVQSGNSLSRNAAFKALKQISSYHINGKILVEAGIIQIMCEEMFTRTIQNEPMDPKQEAAAILANILESGQDVENLKVNVHGHTMASDYIVYNIIYQLKNSTPDELNINLIRILLCLMKFRKSLSSIVSVVKETEASYDLIELINNPNEELVVASLNLLIALSSSIGHTLSDKLCKTGGLPESLIQNPSEITRITEKHAISATFLAKLPHQNLTLNLALLNKKTIPRIIESLDQIQETGTRTSRHATAYFEGLVGILVRFTTTSYDHQMVFAAMRYNFTSVFTEVLVKTSSDEVQRLAAIGLENLSKHSTTLSRPPRSKTTKNEKTSIWPKWLSHKSPKAGKVQLCSVHGGVCSAEDTFCLLDAGAVERLLACLDHENAAVVEASLSAISTLLDDKVNVEMSVSLLSKMQAMRVLLNVVREHKEDFLLQKLFWVIERFLSKSQDTVASDILQDRLFPATLVNAYHHGDDYTKKVAEKILIHLNKMPTFSTYFTI